jgi:hypothetical protein
MVELKDHETLSISLLVTEDMFPQKRIAAPEVGTVTKLTTVFFLLSLAYWALFLRNLPGRPAPYAAAPEGYTAGELGSILCLQGANLNMMVFSWAQLGYLQMELQPNGKVLLHRQMEMGNERSGFEQRVFKQLFTKRDTVDAGTMRYGALYRSVAATKPNLSAVMDPKSGNMLVFRVLAAISGMFAGVTIAVNLASGAGLQWFLVVLLGFAALISAWHMQAWAVNLFAPNRTKLWLAVALSGIWLALGALAGRFGTGLGMALCQGIAGLLMAIGGRRTPAGRVLMGETLGLRRHLKSLSKEQLKAITLNDPEYFYRMAPYALALGVDKAFAKRFGKQSMEDCPYIVTGVGGRLRASQWNDRMRQVLRGMNTHAEQSHIEKIIAFFQGFFK